MSTTTPETLLSELFDANPSDPEKPDEDNDAPVAGWTVEGYDDSKYMVPRALDVVPLETWTRSDLPCVLLGVTRYFIRGYGTRDRKEWEYEEQYTTYVGMVYCPPVETPNAAYSGVRPTQSDGGDWFQTGASDDVSKPAAAGVETLAEAVRVHTDRLADGLSGHAKEHVCECGWTRTNDRWSHDEDCPVAADDWRPADPDWAWAWD